MREARKSFLLRINAPLWRELEAWAQEDFRSVNGQIEFLLREAVKRRKGRPEPEPEGISGNTNPPPPPSTVSNDLEMGMHD